MELNRSSLLLACIVACWTACGSMADADWISCQNKPTRDCLLEEAFRGDSGPLTGKDRLGVMIPGGAMTHPDARAVYSSMNKAQETMPRVVVVRNLAAYSTKAGDVASALRFAGEFKDPLNRRGALFAIAHMLPQ